MTNLMLITLQTLSVFGLIFTMTRGGPGTKSQTLPLYMYEQAFSFGNCCESPAGRGADLFRSAGFVYGKSLPIFCEDKRRTFYFVCRRVAGHFLNRETNRPVGTAGHADQRTSLVRR